MAATVPAAPPALLPALVPAAPGNAAAFPDANTTKEELLVENTEI
jgi:hypothetical protein